MCGLVETQVVGRSLERVDSARRRRPGCGLDSGDGGGGATRLGGGGGGGGRGGGGKGIRERAVRGGVNGGAHVRARLRVPWRLAGGGGGVGRAGGAAITRRKLLSI